jgi:hypothetical protein
MSRKLSAVAVALFLSLSAPAVAQNDNSRVMVPDAPAGGAAVAGCFRADRNLYGPFRLTMCLRTRGTYQVTGGGMRCDGRLTWRASGRNIDIDLRRTSCNRGMAWAAAHVSCRGSGLAFNILDSIFGRNQRVMVPNTPAIRLLTCTYHPTVRGERIEHFTARRV